MLGFKVILSTDGSPPTHRNATYDSHANVHDVDVGWRNPPVAMWRGHAGPRVKWYDATGHPKGWSRQKWWLVKKRSIQSEFRNSMFC